MIIASSADFREAARRRLPRFLFDYIDGGSYDEVTLRRNVSDLSRIALRQRTLVNVSSVRLGVELFGQRWTLPVGLAPVGLSGMYVRRGEVQAARAALSKGVPFCLSTVSVCSLEEIAAATNATFWFQLYMLRDRGFMQSLMERARQAGASALVFTVDMPVPGARYRDLHSGMSGKYAKLRRFAQALARPHWAWNVGILGRPHTLGNVAPVLAGATGLEDFVGWLAANFDPTTQWADIAWIRRHWDGPLIIKGILDREDALAAADSGADAIIVSNHGGRQLDGVQSTTRALPAIADALGDRVPLLVDSGVRSGLDVVRMLSLGAKMVLLGRAWAFALAARGGAGVASLLDILEKEMRVAMALTGSTDVSQLDRSKIAGTRLPVACE